MKLPRYFICNNKAVKFELVNDSEVGVYVYDSTSGTFIENIDYLETVYSAYDSEEVTEEEFNDFVKELENE